MRGSGLHKKFKGRLRDERGRILVGQVCMYILWVYSMSSTAGVWARCFFYEKRGHESLEKKTKANIIIAFCNAGFGEGLGVRPSPNNGLNPNSAKNGLMVKISKKF